MNHLKEWTDEAKAEWWDQAAIEPSHVLTFHPTFRLKLTVPPWEDPQRVITDRIQSLGRLLGMRTDNEGWIQGLDDCFIASIECVDASGTVLEMEICPSCQEELILPTDGMCAKCTEASTRADEGATTE